MELADDRARGSPGEVLRVALLLGLTSFGGPIAHLGFFQREYVERRRWLTPAAYADLVALCQVLPGPASSQVGIAIGLLRAGWAGALAAWAGFTLPSAVLLTGFALLAADVDLAGAGWVHGLKLAAVAIVAAAVLAMWRALAPDAPRRALAVAALAVTLALPGGPLLQVAVMAAGAAAGWLALRRAIGSGPAEPMPSVGSDGRFGPVAGLVFFGLLAGLPLLATLTGSTALAVIDAFYRAGALVFGGGHVVLPLLAESVVTPGWVDADTFLAGYGAAQAVPGPLFTFAAFLGASVEPEPNGIAGAAVAVLAIFAPSFLLIAATLPTWTRVRSSTRLRAALAGTNAAVVGLLAAALVDPLWLGTVRAPADAVLVVLAFAALVAWRVPAWAVVLALAVATQVARAAGLA